MTTTITPDAPLQLTTDDQNHALSLQLLRLYASTDTKLFFHHKHLAGQPIPTLAEFARRLTRMGN
jgi:hypothetical protein